MHKEKITLNLCIYTYEATKKKLSINKFEIIKKIPMKQKYIRKINKQIIKVSLPLSKFRFQHIYNDTSNQNFIKHNYIH